MNTADSAHSPDIAARGADSGKDGQPAQDVVGLAGVAYRAEQLGGTMTVEAAPGAGCGVSVHIPTAGAVGQARLEEL